MIFKKIFVYFVSTILIVTVSIGMVIFYFLGNYVIDQKKTLLMNAGEKISSISTEIVKYDNNDFNNYFRIFSELSASNLESDIILANPDGSILFNTGIMYNDRDLRIPKDLIETVNGGINSSKVEKIGSFKDSSLIVGIPIKFDSHIIGGIYLITFLPEITRLRGDIIKIYLLSGLVVLLLSLILIFLFTKRVADPIKQLKLASKNLTNGDFRARVKVYNKNDEIGELAETFNDMADSIEKSENMRRSFISDVSHELRTPMTTITGFVQGILDNTIPPDKREIYLNVVLDESKRLSKLISDLLDVSKLESDEVSLELSTFNINELIRLSIISFENKFNEKNLTVNAMFESEIEEVVAEKDSIKRVVTNLLDNAIKFSYHKGIIDISTKRKGNKVYISIKNEGEGISKDDKKTIFERFYKVDKSRSQNKTGVGLGLYIVKRIINKHGEKIWIESEEGKFAEFIFTLKK
ncbi:MAG: HAMP domain-containing histidine kinase [Ruminococcaceae bacterium]|nr:HAMP domain-containing histidine kinase [Oscillospiraceae bacterium]